ncbi:MAG TPA: glycosyltransferase [Ktedonobacterales bacterium]|nr:glycosyltransferase [Ktedonobacterales bacterium]
MLIYQSIITALLVLLLLNTINNLRLFQRPTRRALPPATRGPLVSVLVPARNEERSIGRCVESLARQDYPHLEILVLDDQSEDATGAIVEELAQRYPSVRLLRGQPLPANWHGKAYACAQLARAARGDWLLFVDADTVHAPETVSTALRVALEQQADLLTMMPQVLEKSVGEALLLPLIPLTFGGFLPMGMMAGRKYPLVAGALGPFLLFRRESYERVGGHEATRRDIVEDMKLARLVKQQHGKLVWIDGTALTQVRFYHNLGEAWRGLAKTTFAALDYSVTALLPGSIACLAIFVGPYLFLGYALVTQRYDAALFWLPLSQIVLAWATRWLLAQRFHMHRAMAFLHPVMMVATILLTAQAACQAIFGGGVTWKGRAYQFSGHGERPGLQKLLTQALMTLRLGLASLLGLLGWRWGSDALDVAALLPLVIWTCALLQHALTPAAEAASNAALGQVADGASGLGALAYLLFSGQMTLLLALFVVLALAASVLVFHWRSLPIAGLITLGCLLLLIGGANFSLIRVVLFWWAVGALFLERRPVGQFLGAWFHRQRPPL